MAQSLGENHDKPSNSSSLRACSLLLARIGGELRGAILLARDGYIFQSWALSAGLFEHAVSLGHIRDREQLGQRWLQHIDLSRTPWRFSAALHSTLESLQAMANLERLKALYSQFCAAKHANPGLQTRYGAQSSPFATIIHIDPYVSAGVIKTTRYGLAWTLYLTNLALHNYIRWFVPEDRLAARHLILTKRIATLLRTELKGNASASA